MGTGDTLLFFLLALLTGKPREIFARVLRQWALLVPAAAALLMYGVLYAEPRYLPSFVVLFWLGLFAGLGVREDKKSRIVAGAATGAAACIMVILTATTVFGSANPTDWRSSFKWKEPQIQYEIAQALHGDGIKGETRSRGFDRRYSTTRKTTPGQAGEGQNHCRSAWNRREEFLGRRPRVPGKSASGTGTDPRQGLNCQSARRGIGSTLATAWKYRI